MENLRKEMQKRISFAISSGMHMGELFEFVKELKAALVLFEKISKTKEFKTAITNGIKELEKSQKKWEAYKIKHPDFLKDEDKAMTIRAKLIPLMKEELKRAY